MKSNVFRKIYRYRLDQIDFKTNKVINTLNPHSYCISFQDLEFKKALLESDILLPDGVGIIWAERFLNKNRIKKIAGYDFFIFLLDKLNKKNGSVFFLGSSKNNLDKIKAKLSIQYPNIKSSFYSPPFKSVFSEKDSIKMCDKINLFKPDVLFVGMTAPKQEKWVEKYKNKLDACNICCIGAVFDFYTGNIKRSSSLWIKLGLEWFPRFLKEPKRLFRRNFVSTPKFILEIIFLKLFGKGFM